MTPGVPKRDERSLPAQAGRGAVMLLALSAPFIPTRPLFTLGLLAISPQVLIGVLVVLFAALHLRRAGTPLRRRWAALPVALLAWLAVSAVMVHTRGQPLWAATGRLAGLLLLASAVAVLYAGVRLERIAVLTALVLSGLAAALLGLGDLLGVSLVQSFDRLFSPGSDHWSLLMRATGPLRSGVALAWLAAVLLPLVTAAAYALRDRSRDVAALGVAILWLAALATFSRTAPLAALFGMLVVLLSRSGRRSRYVGISVALLFASWLAMLHPALRARWSVARSPVAVITHDITPLEGPGSTDSLRFTFLNPGPLPWRAGYEMGFHRFSFRRSGYHKSLVPARWQAHVLGRTVKPGEQVTVTLPFNPGEGVGLLAVDLRGPGGWLGGEEGFDFLLAYSNRAEGTGFRLEALVPLDEPELRDEARRAIDRGSPHSRVAVWGDAFSIFRSRPWTGYGPGAMRQFLGYDAHSLILEAATSGGLIGLAATWTVIVVLLYGLIRRKGAEATALGGVLVVAVLHGFTDHALGDPSAGLVAALLTGIIFAAGYGPPEAEDAVPSETEDTVPPATAAVTVPSGEEGGASGVVKGPKSH